MAELTSKEMRDQHLKNCLHELREAYQRQVDMDESNKKDTARSYRQYNAISKFISDWLKTDG